MKRRNKNVLEDDNKRREGKREVEKERIGKKVWKRWVGVEMKERRTKEARLGSAKERVHSLKLLVVISFILSLCRSIG